MSTPKLPQTLRTRCLVCDGRMGIQLMAAGLGQGASGEAWNLSEPDQVLDIQRRYVQAGADCIITDTLESSRLALRRHGHEAEVARIYRENCPLPTMLQSNTGRPITENGQLSYKHPPANMAAEVPRVLEAGARIAGSCCGSNSEHTAALRAVVDSSNRS